MEILFLNEREVEELIDLGVLLAELEGRFCWECRGIAMAAR
jgi:hypothetical protein